MSLVYPRVYRQPASTRRGYLSTGIIVILIGLAGMVFFGATEGLKTGARGTLLIVCGIFLTWGVGCLVAYWRVRVTLHEHSIEVQGLWLRREARREDLYGWRLMGVGHGPPCLRLEGRPGSRRTLTLPASIDHDDLLDEWGRGLVNLQAQEEQQSMDAVLSDPDLPGSSDEKIHALRSARRVGSWYFWTCLGSSFWLLWYPKPYNLAIALAAMLPWVGMGLAGWRPSLYKLDGKSHEVGVVLFSGLWLPMLMLALRAFLDVEVLDLAQLLIHTVLFAAACVVATLLLVEQSRRASNVWWLVVSFLLYSYGVVTLANRQLDGDEYQVIPTEVLASKGGDPPQVTLRPWGPEGFPTQVEVSSDLFARARPGDQVCVYVWPGALGVRWFVVEGCPN